MKQILQNPRDGKLELAEVPAPTVAPGQVLVRNRFSVVSPGTDTLVMSFARKSLVGKARSRPDLVQQVVRKLRQEGPLPTYRAVTTRLESPQPLGYSCAGIVESVGEGVTGFAPGDRVACAGAGYANHAELVVVPENLVAAVPDGADLAAAAWSTLGAIALQGVRVAAPTLGEVAAVIGLGLIGQLVVQLLRANGCRVAGIDLDAARVKQGLDQGAEWGGTPDWALGGFRESVCEGHGVDLALVTASAESSAPLALAAQLCRQRGRLSVVGAMPMELDRRVFYEKELELRMSTSYGPGRYDWSYEEAGLDYPLPHVRWTENRNLQAFLQLLAGGQVRPDVLDAQTRPFSDAVAAYEELARGERASLAVVFEYPESISKERTVVVSAPRPAKDGEIGIAFLGAGNYAKGVLLPGLPRSGVRRVSLATATGPSARRTAEKFGFASCGTDVEAVLSDGEVDLVFVATRHDSHASLAARALRAGKAVWLEKPVALDPEQLAEVAEAARESDALLAVGYNRRFSPHARAAREFLEARRGPLVARYSVAAGPPPRGTWITDPAVGGGRVIGEVCHFVDLCTYLVGAPPTRVFARAPGRDPEVDDSLVALLGFADGSTATLEYLARASGELPKERFEASADGRTIVCDNYRHTTAVGVKGGTRTINQDKGQATALREVIEAVRTGAPSPFPLDQVLAVSRATFAMLESARTGREVEL